MQEDLTHNLEERHFKRGALKVDTDIDLLNYKRKTDSGNSDRRLTRVSNIGQTEEDHYEEQNNSCSQTNAENIPNILSLEHQNEYCSDCNCMVETFSDSGSIGREPSTSKQCSWKDRQRSIFRSHIKGRSCVFPFKATPSGNLKVVPKQVVFETKKVSVLVADPGRAKINVKADFEEPIKLLKSMEGTQCSCRSVITNSQKDEIEPHCELCLQSLGYGKYEPIDWTKILLPQKSDLVGLLLHRIVNNIQADSVVHVGNKKFHCHMLVLQCYSAYFENCSCGEYKLAEGKVTPGAFASIYKWMIYTQCDSYQLLQRENILEVLNAAQFLGVKELEDQCWSFINSEELFSGDKAFTLYLQAKQMGNRTVMELMVSRIMHFFLTLVSCRDFLQLSLDELCFLLSSSHICVHSEIEVFMAAVRWLMSDWNHRRKHVCDVMKCVRFGLIAPWQLVDIRRNPENPEFLEVTAVSEVQQMIEDGLAYAIIKYWYGNQTEDYYHWIDLLGLKEPSGRNWCGDPKNYVTYREFLQDLDTYREQQILERDSRQDIHQSLASQAKPAVLSCENDKSDRATPEAIHSSLPPNLAAVIPPPAPSRDDERETNSVPAVEEFLMHRKAHVISETRNCALCRADEGHNKYSSPAQEIQPRKEQSKYSVPARVLEFENKLREKNSKPDVKAGAVNKNWYNRDTEKHFPHNNLEMRSSASVTTPSPESSKSRFSKSELTTSSNLSRELINAQQVASALGPVCKNYLRETSLFFADRESVLVFGGVGPRGFYSAPGKDMYRYHPQDDSWEHVGEMPEPRHHHGVAFLKGHVYIAGGVDPRRTDTHGKSLVTDTLWSIDPVTRKWYSETSMLTARQNFGLVVCNSKLYAIGGQDVNGRILSSVERFNPTTGVWEYVASLEVGRMGIAVAKYRDHIWVAGGMSAVKKAPVSRSVECYDTRNNVWISNTSLRLPRCFSCLFVMNDKLYLVGGAGGFTKEVHNIQSLASIDLWDPENKEWTLVTEMANPRHAHTVAYLDSEMVIIGGVTTDTMKVLTSVERYCCKTNKWLQGVCSLPASLSGHGSITLPPASLM